MDAGVPARTHETLLMAERQKHGERVSARKLR
jgi:hypothetical protein